MGGCNMREKRTVRDGQHVCGLYTLQARMLLEYAGVNIGQKIYMKYCDIEFATAETACEC